MDQEPDPSAERYMPMEAVLPPDMAKRAERAGARKAEQPAMALFMLAVLAGAFIAFGATFAATVTVSADSDTTQGVARLLGGIAFSLAYVLAIVGGAELFTTNNLLVMAWAHGRLPTLRLLRAWGIAFAGNFVGAVSTCAMLILAGQHTEAGGSVGTSLLASAARINGLTLAQVLFLGLLGNMLLCLGAWLTYSARSTTDSVVALVGPVSAFYVLGLEHAVAVMFYLPCAMLIRWLSGPEFWVQTGLQPPDYSLFDFLAALVPVTIGNIIGGGVLVALVYWFVYLRPQRV